MKKLLTCVVAIACILSVMILPVSAASTTGVTPPGYILDEANLFMRAIEPGTTFGDVLTVFPNAAVYYGTPDSLALVDSEVYAMTDLEQSLNTGCFVKLNPTDADFYRVVVRGDANGDGDFQLVDYWWLVQYLNLSELLYNKPASEAVPEEYWNTSVPNALQLAAFDYEGDGAVDYVDAYWMLQVLLIAGLKKTPNNPYALMVYAADQLGYDVLLENLGFESAYYFEEGITAGNIIEATGAMAKLYKPSGDMYSLDELVEDPCLLDGTRVVIELDGVILMETVMYII